MANKLTHSEAVQLRDTLLPNIHRGIQILDQTVKDWFRKVDLEVLDQMSCKKCVLGQLYGDYMTGVQKASVPFGKFAHHGFGLGWQMTIDMLVDSTYGMDCYRILTDLWKEQIKLRLDREERNDVAVT